MKVKGFVVTNWNLNTNENYLEIMKKNKIRFLAFGEEVCKTGKKHHQTFLYFWNDRSVSKKNINAIGNYFGDIHCFVEPMFGSFKSNEHYCSKESTLTKLGDEPRQGARGDIWENKNLILEEKLKPEDIMLSDPTHYHQYKNTYKDIEAYVLSKKFRTWMTKGIWLFGSTGTGKSHYALNKFNPETHYIKDLNVKWWDNYKGQETVIIQEFRGEIKFGEILDLVDKWPKNVPIRNKPSVPFLAKKLIITSPKKPEDIFYNACDDEDNIAQLVRRFEVYECKKVDERYFLLDADEEEIGEEVVLG